MNLKGQNCLKEGRKGLKTPPIQKDRKDSPPKCTRFFHHLIPSRCTIYVVAKLQPDSEPVM